ncbi:hypothetical protein N9L01_00195 [bacterium]|nr:hypothetical protein [bacterium]
MVQTLSIIGAVFTVGGSYIAVDTLRDVLIAKTITMPYATRMAIASAAAFGGLYVMTNLSAQAARKRTKQNLGKQLMAAEVFDAAAYDLRKERAWSNMLSNAPVDIEVKQVDLFHDKYILAHDDAHRAAQSWLRKNEKAQFNEIHYMLYQIDAGKWGIEYVALNTMDSEELTFHDWSNQEMMTHGKDDSFEDWVEHEIDSHGNLTLRDWADDEEESHIQRYGAEGKTRGYSLNRFNKQRRPSGDSFRRKGRRSALRSMMAAEDDTVYMIETEYHSWDNWQNDCIAYDSFGPYATEAGAKKALKEMMEDEAERWTHHDDLRDPDTNEPMFTFGLDLDEYGNLEIKPSGMSLGDFTQKHTKTEHKGGRAFDGMTYSGVVVAKQIKAADSDDDDDDTRPIPDREPRRGAPDLWFAEDDVRQFTPQEAVEYLRSGDNCVWLIDYSDENYGDDERPHYDYPIEDPDELETMIFEGVFDENTAANGFVPAIANGTSYDLDMWKDEPDGKHPSFAENPDWMKGMDEEEYAAWANSWNSRSRGAFTDKDAEDDSKKTFPPIFKKATTGKIQEWRIRTEQLPDGNWAYISSHGQVGGSMVEGKGVVIKAGKQGRTVEEQANAEAAAKWKKKKETGYFESADEAKNNVVVLPMTALNFKKRAHDIDFPAIGQPKLDGVRCLARLEADGTVSLTSRKNKLFPGMDHIREELATRLKSLGNSKGSPFPNNIVVDGELYADPKELTFQQSTGVVRRNNKTPEDLEDEKKIKLNVYDCINLDDPDMDFIDRYNLMADSLSNMDSIAMVDNTTLSDKDDVDPLHDKFVTQGYEGLMIRNVKGPYKLNGKSKHLQKYKDFQDDEFKIVGYEEGKGNYEGTVIWICEMPDGKRFRIKPNGTHEYRSKLFEEADSHIGKEITVRFFELTDGGLPRHPTGGWFRDYEAESFDAESSERFEAFSISDRPVSVSFGKGTSGNAKMKAVFTDGSGDTKTTQFGYKGMSDYTKHGDEGRKSSYLARHGAKSSGQKWNDPTTAGSLSRWVLWNKKSLSESKKSFKNKFNLRAEETDARYSVADLGYQDSIFLTDPGRRAVWDYETDYSVEDAE